MSTTESYLEAPHLHILKTKSRILSDLQPRIFSELYLNGLSVYTLLMAGLSDLRGLFLRKLFLILSGTRRSIKLVRLYLVFLFNMF